MKPFPKAFGEKLISDVVKDINRGTDKFEFEDPLRLHKLYQPARIRYQEHISSTQSAGAATAYPQLPSIAECETLLKEAKEMEETLKITEHPQSMVQESEGSIVPLDLNKDVTYFGQEDIAKEKSSVPFELTKDQEKSQESESKDKSVITSQPTTSNIGLFSSERQDAISVPNFEDVPTNAPMNFDVMYKEIPMSKGVADFLTDPNVKRNIPQVHQSCGKVDERKGNLITIEVDENDFIMEQETAEQETAEQGDAIADDDDDDTIEEEKILKTKRFRKLADDPNREIVFIPQQIDTSNIDGPVPLPQQLVGYEYCTLCSKKFKDKRYLKIHMTRLCPFLTVIERVKCRLCGKIYQQDKTYHNHLTKHTKVLHYQCPRCGKKFEHQNSRFHHDKFCK